MNARHMLALTICGGLAACGGVHAQYSSAYDPNGFAQSGPMAVSVGGSPDAGISQAAIAAAVSDELRQLGLPSDGTTAGAGSDAARPKVVLADAGVSPDVGIGGLARGLTVADAGATGVAEPDYRLTILFGSVATRLAQASDRDAGARLCAMVDSMLPAPSAAAASTANPASTGGMPVLAVLCRQDTFQTMAFDTLGGTGPEDPALRSGMDTLLKHLFPSQQMLGRDIGAG
jgi:hypothetical protein